MAHSEIDTMSRTSMGRSGLSNKSARQAGATARVLRFVGVFWLVLALFQVLTVHFDGMSRTAMSWFGVGILAQVVIGLWLIARRSKAHPGRSPQ